MTKLRLPVLVLSMVLVFLMILSVSTYGVTGNPVNVGVKPDTSGINLSSQNLKYLWNYTSSNGNFNYTAAGDLFNNNMMGFIGYSVSAGSATLSGINNDGAAVWNLSITNYINFTVYGRVGSYSQTILVESGQSSAPGLLHLTLYAGSTGSPIWERNITLSSGESSLVLPLGYSMTTGSTSGNNDTIVLVSSNSSGPYTTENYENSIRLINGANGTVQWYVNYSTTSVGSTPLSRFLQVIPPVTGLTDGGVLYGDIYLSGGSPPTISSNTVLITGNDSIVFNITTPTSASDIASLMDMDSVGNYAGSGYDIAVALIDVKVGTDVLPVTYGAIAVISLNGKVVYSSNFSNVPGSAVELQQSLYYGYLSNFYRLPPKPYIGPLYDYTGASSYPDLVYELIKKSSIPQQDNYMNKIYVLDVYTGKNLWNKTISSVINVPIMVFQIPAKPYIIIESNKFNVGAPESTIIALNGRDGGTIWSLTNVTGTDLPASLFSSYMPSMLSNNGNAPDFATVSTSVVNGTTLLNVTSFNGNNGTAMFEKTIKMNYPVSKYNILPFGYLDTAGAFAVSINYNGNSVGTNEEKIIGINGTNGNPLFNITFNVNNAEPDLTALAGTFWSIFYPGLHNGQLALDGKTDDLVVSAYSGLYGMEYEQYGTLSVTLSASVVTHVVPFNDTFYANVTGGVAPYNYTWNVNGTSSTTVSPYYNQSFTVSGIYNVSVKVRDGAGNVASSNNVTIDVKPSNSSSNNSTTRYYLVEGVVKSANESPIEGVNVLSNEGNRTTTLSNGEFLIYLPNGTWKLTFSKPGYNTVTVNITIRGGYSNLLSVPMNSSNAIPASTGSNANSIMEVFYIIIPVIIIVMAILIYLFIITREKNKIDFADVTVEKKNSDKRGRKIANTDKGNNNKPAEKGEKKISKENDKHAEVKSDLTSDMGKEKDKEVSKKVIKKTKECPICGEILPYEAKSCTSCGETFENQ